MSAIIPAAALTLAAIYLVFHRVSAARHVTPTVETDVHSLDWLTAPDLKPLCDTDPAPVVDEHWRSVVVGSLTAAEELLDRLEAAGFAEREVVIVGNATYLVRWR